jgi:H+/Cl- antiporter ClcA
MRVREDWRRRLGADLRDPRLYLTAVVAAVLGFGGALLTLGFVKALDGIHALLWEDLPDAFGVAQNAFLFVVPVCVVGGVLVGVARKRLGEHPKGLEEALVDFRRDRGFDYRHIPQAIVTSILSLGFGAALGPEAALVAIIGGLGTAIGRFVTTNAARAQALVYAGLAGSLGALFSTPGAAALPIDDTYARERPGRVWLILPGLAAAGAGWWVFATLSSGSGYFDYTYPSYRFAASDLGWVLVATAAGTVLGLLLVVTGRGTDRIAGRLRSRPVLQSACGGLALGLLASASALVLFSGHEGIQTLIDDTGASIGFLLGVAAAKLAATTLCLSTGWKGGRFFPTMFMGAAVGLALSAALPSLPTMICLAAAMTASIGALIRKPIATAIFMVLLFPAALYPAVIVAALVSSVAARLAVRAAPAFLAEPEPAVEAAGARD